MLPRVKRPSRESGQPIKVPTVHSLFEWHAHCGVIVWRILISQCCRHSRPVLHYITSRRSDRICISRGKLPMLVLVVNFSYSVYVIHLDPDDSPLDTVKYPARYTKYSAQNVKNLSNCSVSMLRFRLETQALFSKLTINCVAV